MRCPVCHRRLVPGTACPLHAERPRLPLEEPEPLVPPQVPGLPLLAPLGTGGFSQVFSARREQDGAEVAVKVALGPSASPRFAHEAAALRRVGPPTAPRPPGTERACPGAAPSSCCGIAALAWPWPYLTSAVLAAACLVRSLGWTGAVQALVLVGALAVCVWGQGVADFILD